MNAFHVRFNEAKVSYLDHLAGGPFVLLDLGVLFRHQRLRRVHGLLEDGDEEDAAGGQVQPHLTHVSVAHSLGQNVARDAVEGSQPLAS